MPPKTNKQTAEEKKQARNRKIAEKKLIAEELKKQQQYDHISREIQYGKVTIQRHEKSWRAMLIQITLPRMRSELEYTWQNFERIIDSKDFQISLLMDELKEAEDQYARNLKSHMDNIDKLIILCYDQLGELWYGSREIILNLYKAATFETNDVLVVDKEHEDYLKTMLYMLDKAKKETSKLMRGEYLSRQEIEISKQFEFSKRFTEELKKRFETMWNEAEIFLKKHITEYSQRKVEFLAATEYDAEVQRSIAHAWRNLRDKFDTIKMYKTRLQEIQSINSRKINDLQREWSHFDKIYKTVKSRVEHERSMDDRNLTILTSQTCELMVYLQKLEKKGEQLLRLSAICRKYETLDEKTMAFPDHYIYDSNDRGQRKSLDQHDTEEEYLPELKMFWHRLAAVDASRYMISEQCQILRNENKELKLQLFQYCECLNCGPQMHFLYENLEFTRK